MRMQRDYKSLDLAQDLHIVNETGAPGARTIQRDAKIKSETG